MKIAIVCFNLGWQTGGPRLIFSFAHALMRRGHKVVIYAPDYDPTTYPELSRGLDVRKIVPLRPVSWQYRTKGLFGRILEKFAQRRAVNLLAEEAARVMEDDFDVVNFHDFAYKAAGWYAKKNPRATAIWTMNDVPYMYLPKASFLYDLASRIWNAYADLIERRSFRHIRAAVVFIERNRRWAEQRGMKTGLIWPGIESDAFYAPVKRFSGPKKSFTLLGVGAFNKYRRYDDIVSAAALLRKEGYDTKVLLIAKDIWNMREDRAALMEHIKRLGMESRVDVRFNGATEDELKRAYKESDILVAATHLPPPRNGFSWGLALFEAIASGVLVLLSSANDAREALADGKTALFFAPTRPEEIAEKAKFAMNNPEVYYKIASAGQELVKKHMSWDMYADRFLQLVRSQKPMSRRGIGKSPKKQTTLSS